MWDVSASYLNGDKQRLLLYIVDEDGDNGVSHSQNNSDAEHHGHSELIQCAFIVHFL